MTLLDTADRRAVLWYLSLLAHAKADAANIDEAIMIADLCFQAEPEPPAGWASDISLSLASDSWRGALKILDDAIADTQRKLVPMLKGRVVFD